jgi:GntR family transcriptional regulator
LPNGFDQRHPAGGDIDAHYQGYYTRDQGNEPPFSSASGLPGSACRGEKTLVHVHFDRATGVLSRCRPRFVKITFSAPENIDNCYYGLYTVKTVTNERKSCLIGPISTAADGTLYQQIVDRLKREISEGRLKPGVALPSFRQLAEDLLVSVITVKRAYEELEREGIIFRRQGLGTFVAEQGFNRSRDAKLATAKQLLRAAFREAVEAGLEKTELADLAREILKEK